MQDQQRRDREAEHELRSFPERHVQAVPVVERTGAEQEMGEGGKEKHQFDRLEPPEGEERTAPPFHRVERDQHRTVVGRPRLLDG